MQMSGLSGSPEMECFVVAFLCTKGWRWAASRYNFTVDVNLGTLGTFLALLPTLRREVTDAFMLSSQYRTLAVRTGTFLTWIAQRA